MARYVLNAFVAGLTLASRTALSQEFPARPIRIVTSAPGGGSDFVARMIAQGLPENTGQPVIVENRALVAVDTALKALGDGIALMAGEVQVSFATAASVAPFMKTSKLRALAVSSAQPSALFPGRPTVAAAGLPGFEAVTTHALFARAGTPSATVGRINREVVKVLTQPQVKQNFLNAGIEVLGSTPQQLAEAIKSEVARMSKVIKEAGIKAD